MVGAQMGAPQVQRMLVVADRLGVVAAFVGDESLGLGPACGEDTFEFTQASQSEFGVTGPQFAVIGASAVDSDDGDQAGGHGRCCCNVSRGVGSEVGGDQRALGCGESALAHVEDPTQFVDRSGQRWPVDGLGQGVGRGGRKLGAVQVVGVEQDQCAQQIGTGGGDLAAKVLRRQG